MRGKARRTAAAANAAGITPAYAGKSGILWFAVRPLQDHPRLCGEKSTKPQPPMAM